MKMNRPAWPGLVVPDVAMQGTGIRRDGSHIAFAAVDENVIPLGSYVWLDAFGRWFRADDTGGAIQGIRTEPAGALDGTWITQCRRVSPGLARVFRVEAETVDGHPAASNVYTQEDASCAN